MAIGHGWADPFIAKTADGWDTKVDIQSGKVLEIAEGNNNNGMYNISVRADNTKFGISGWINANRDPLIFRLLQEAHKRDENIVVRVERQRIKDEDKTPEISIQDIAAASDKTSRLARKISGVYLPNKKEWLLTVDKYSNPEEDPESTQKLIDYINQTWEATSNSNALNEEEIVEMFEGEAPLEPEIPIIKGKPFDLMQNRMTMYFFVLEAFKKAEIDFSETQVEKIAIALNIAADKIQEIMVGAIRPGDYSHTRARFLIFNVVENILPLNEEVLKDPKEWTKNIIIEAQKIVEWAKKTTENS